MYNVRKIRKSEILVITKVYVIIISQKRNMCHKNENKTEYLYKNLPKTYNGNDRIKVEILKRKYRENQEVKV